MKRMVFVGYDSAQDIAYKVLRYSILVNATRQVDVYPIILDDVRKRFGFNRVHDPLQSTEFTYTRFLVPLMCDYQGIAVFMDSDMLALGDVSQLFDLDMTPFALRVVKHDHKPLNPVKMGQLGRVQQAYPRKNWSSLFIADCSKLKCWTKEAVETKSPAWLHRFEPVPDDAIGDLDKTQWNVLDYYDNINTKLVHFTEGGPWLPGCENHPYGDVWFRYKRMWETR